jgi:hypothetical protein
MLCRHCHGRHVVIVQGRMQPCSQCEGLGEIHCCDGLQEQPDPMLNTSEPYPSSDGEETRLDKAG